VKADIGESLIVRTIKQQDADGRIVIVDLEGVASRLVSRAISQADLVLTPMRATTLDATIGVRSLALVQEEEEALGRPIRHAIVFTMTRAIKSKQHSAIEVSLREQGVDIINPPLMERAAFSALFEFGGNLRTMPPQGNMEPAVENAAQFPVVAATEYAAAPELNVNGQVSADVSRTIPVISLASGRILDVHARLGDAVTKGQLLMRGQSDDISQAYSDY